MDPKHTKEKTMTSTLKWQCTVCGLKEQGPKPPATCPKCGVKADRFIKIK